MEWSILLYCHPKHFISRITAICEEGNAYILDAIKCIASYSIDLPTRNEKEIHMGERLRGMRRVEGRDGRIDGPIPSWRLDDLLLQGRKITRDGTVEALTINGTRAVNYGYIPNVG